MTWSNKEIIQIIHPRFCLMETDDYGFCFYNCIIQRAPLLLPFSLYIKKQNALNQVLDL